MKNFAIPIDKQNKKKIKNMKKTAAAKRRMNIRTNIGKCSIPLLQRKYKLTFSAAKKMMEGK